MPSTWNAGGGAGASCGIGWDGPSAVPPATGWASAAAAINAGTAKRSAVRPATRATVRARRNASPGSECELAYPRAAHPNRDSGPPPAPGSCSSAFADEDPEQLVKFDFAVSMNTPLVPPLADGDGVLASGVDPSLPSGPSSSCVRYVRAGVTSL